MDCVSSQLPSKFLLAIFPRDAICGTPSHLFDSKMEKLASTDEAKPFGLAEAEMDRKSANGPPPQEHGLCLWPIA